MNFFRRKSGPAEIWKSHILAQLRSDRCWICDHAASEVERDFFWFSSEQYYEPEVVDRMRLAHGFCANHTRRFLQTGAVSVITAVYSYLAWYAIRQINASRQLLHEKPAAGLEPETCRKAAALLRPKNPCPMCVNLRCGEEIHLRAMTGALKLPEVGRAYVQSPGLCLPHFREAAFLGDWHDTGFLTDDMRQRLQIKLAQKVSSTALLEQTVGWNRTPALDRRTRSREMTPLGLNRDGAESVVAAGGATGRWSPTFAELLASLAELGCPVCNACDQGVDEYLAWLGCQMEPQPSIPDSWDASFNVCADHLWALYTAGYESAAAKIGTHLIQEWLFKLHRLAEGLEFKPSNRLPQRLALAVLARLSFSHSGPASVPRQGESLRIRAAAFLESPSARLQRLRTTAFRDPLCQACLHVRAITRQRIDLILRILEDPIGRKVYHAGAGLCLRHCVEAADLAETPAALEELLAAQLARLRILEWELREASRKYSWSVRYESKGPEADAWRRAARQFCGV